MQALVLIALGSILGANARYFISTWAASRLGDGFPYGTLLINLSGSFLLGVLLTAGSARLGIGDEARLLAGTGFFGAYTTYSTFAYETVALLRRGAVLPALANVGGNVVLGIGAAAAGILLVQRIAG